MGPGDSHRGSHPYRLPALPPRFSPQVPCSVSALVSGDAGRLVNPLQFVWAGDQGVAPEVAAVALSDSVLREDRLLLQFLKARRLRILRLHVTSCVSVPVHEAQS